MKRIQLKTSNILYVLTITVALSSTIACQQSEEKSTKSELEEKPSTPIQEAAFFGNVKVIKQHVAAKSDLNEKDDYGSTPLHIATIFGKTETAKLLIESGANINATSADGSTPLHTASFYGRVDIVKSLLEKKADITVKNSYDATAFESVSAPFEVLKPTYDQISKDLGPLGLKLDYEQLKENRKHIADMIKNHQ